MEHIKLFNNHSEYEAFKASEDYVTPNVSHCIEENEVHYNPYVPASDPRLIVTYNVEDASSPTPLYFYNTEEVQITGVDTFDKVEVDGTEVPVAEIDANSGAYQLSSGEHTVAYTLKDPTIIGAVIDESTFKVGAVFIQCSTITNVTIPNSVTSIGDRAFNSCTGLTSVDITDSVTSIGVYAFSNCSGMTACTIGSGVISIGVHAFSNCSSLTSIEIPDNVTNIGMGAFDGCTSLTSVTIDNGVTTIDDYAFCNCPLDSASQAAISAISPTALSCEQITPLPGDITGPGDQ